MSKTKTPTPPAAETKPTAEPLKSAPPPWHSVATAVALISISFAALPTTADLEEATQSGEVFCSSPFLEGLPPRLVLLVLATTRVFFATFLFGVSLVFFGCTDGLLVTPSYLPISKLKSRPIRMKGLNLLGFFTTWCWNLLGASFLLAGLVPLVVLTQGMESLHSNYPWLPSAALVTFEIAAPCALMVSMVVTYAIWPAQLKNNGHAGDLVHWSQLLMHNVNSILVLVEVALLGNISLYLSHLSLPGLFGQFYVVFSWCMMKVWVPNEAHALYFFLDTTLGATTTISLLVLQGVLIACFGAFCALQFVLRNLMGGFFLGNLLTVLALSFSVCRFR